MLTRFRALAPYFVPIFFGACLFVVARSVPYIQPQWRSGTLLALCIVAVAVVGGAAFIASRVAGMFGRRSLHVAMIPTMFSLGAFGLFILVEHDLTRYAVAALSMGLLSAHFAYVIGMHEERSRYTVEELAHLSFALLVVTSFFFFALAFGISSFTALPEIVIAPATGVLIALFAWETLWEEELATRRSVPVALAFGVLGAELTAALSFLPTSWSVDAAVALILFVSALLAAVRILKGVQLLRRQFMMTLSLTLLVLGTARWS